MGRRSRIILGLNSGTSADGVDAVACEITGRGERMRVRVIGHLTRRYSPDLRRRVLAAMAPAETRTEEICRLHTEVGRIFARAAAAAVKRFDLPRVDLIGSHGQTICHLPPRRRSKTPMDQRPLGMRPKRPVARTSVARRQTPCSNRRDGGATKTPVARAFRQCSHRRDGSAAKGLGGELSRPTTGTTQIGDAALIAAELGAPVVSQFRRADMAVGGQGAPIVPWTDYVLFRQAKRSRVVQNLGGIANLTWLPAGGAPDDVTAFDTGPGNMVIDTLVAHFTRDKQMYDRGGRLARRGRVRREVLDQMLSHPYLAGSPPKSCGREEFGKEWVGELLAKFRRRRIPAEVWIATATRFTATTIAAAYLRYLGSRRRPRLPMDEIILCGGGSKNDALVRAIREAINFDGRLGTVRFSTTNDYGIPVQAKEGVSFAMLAAACVDRVPANLPRVTGAKGRVVLGQVCRVTP